MSPLWGKPQQNSFENLRKLSYLVSLSHNYNDASGGKFSPYSSEWAPLKDE